jgi:ATP-dependent phosphoenolpyruvate carboxykinase
VALELGSPAFSSCRTTLQPSVRDIHHVRSEHLADIVLQVWRINRERAIDYLNTRKRIYVVDGFAGWDERYRIRVRVVCARAYHALFMRNMLIRPSREELEHFHPDYVIYNGGAFPANRYTTGMTSATSVAINFAEKEMVILGTEYAGEMKKVRIILSLTRSTLT